MNRSVSLRVVIAVLALVATACDDNSPTQPTPGPPPPPPLPTIVRITLEGNTRLSAVGETSQLAVTAVYNDGTTKDVTSECQWNVSNPSVVRIAGDGLLTVEALGRTFISVNYQRWNASSTVIATPPGTFAISGRVREPGRGGVAEATVTDRTSRRSATTNNAGLFSIGGLLAPEVRLAVTRPDYEPREVDGTDTVDVDVPLQHIVRINAGESIEPAPLAPNDLTYDVEGVRCQPCRMIRIMIPSNGDMEMRVNWRTPGTLVLYAGGMTFSSSNGALSGFLTIPSRRELIVYVGALDSAGGSHKAFTFWTSSP
jgi:hypothetical protein